MQGFESKGLRLKDALILKNHKLVNEDLWIYQGKIVPGPLKNFHTISYPSKIISPGFIDLQVNGAFGIDFTTQPEGLLKVAKQLPKTGVTSFLATIISSNRSHYANTLPIVTSLKASIAKHAAQCLGIHLEGPFLNPLKKGAHFEKCIFPIEQYPIAFETVHDFYGSLGEVKIITLAPELPKIQALIDKLSKRNIVVSAGHSQATFVETQQAFDAGISMATHLFNAMHPLEQREPGLIGFILKTHSLFYSIIADKIHVHPAMIEFAWRLNPEGCVLITDSIASLGLEEMQDTLFLGTEKLSSKGPHLKGKKTLAGGTTPLIKCIKNFKEITQCSLVDCLETVTLKPAKILGLENIKGSLNIGSDADLVILDHNLNIQDVYISGILCDPQ